MMDTRAQSLVAKQRTLESDLMDVRDELETALDNCTGVTAGSECESLLSEIQSIDVADFSQVCCVLLPSSTCSARIFHFLLPHHRVTIW